MGCFNTVLIACPHCGIHHEHQSKAGNCDLSALDLMEADPVDQVDAAGEHECSRCGKRFRVGVQTIVSVTPVVETH